MTFLLAAAAWILAAQGPPERLKLSPPVSDSYLHEKPADRNCGNHPKVMVSSWDGRPEEHRAAVFRFDLSLLRDRHVDRAELVLRLLKSHGRPVPVELVLLDRPWELREATWSFGFSGKTLATVRPEVRGPRHAYDVTPLVRAWREGAPNHGLMLALPSRGDVRFQLEYASSRAPAADDRPALVVEAGPETFPVGPLEPVPAVRPRPEWTRHAVLVWQRQTDVRRDADLYREAGLKGFHIDRGDGRGDLVRFSKDRGMPYYVGHAAGKGILHLVQDGRAELERTREPVVRPHSLADPRTITQLKDRLSRNIVATRDGLVYAYAFDDEISLGRFNSPTEVDAHPRSVAWYRAWLAHRYGSVEALNRAWGTSYGSLAGAGPAGFEAVRAAHRAPPFAKWNLSPWMEWRAFMDYQFATVLAELTRHANALAPGIPAGFVGGQAPSAYGGYDYALLSRAVQWMEAYDINGTAELLRSFWSRPRRIRMQTYFAGEDADRNTWLLWYRLAAGHQANIAWPDGWFEGDAKAGTRRVSPRLKKLAGVLKEVQGPVSEFVTHPDTELDHDPIGIYYSQPSVRAGWAMDAITHGKTWVSRSSSLDARSSSSGFLRVSWCKMLEDLGYQYRFISYLDVEEGRIDLSRDFKVVILPRTICLSDREAAALRAFVERGGTLVADNLGGLLDAAGRGRARGALDDLFGVVRDEAKGYLNGKTLVEIDGERLKRPFGEQLHAYDGAIRHGELVAVERGTRSRAADGAVNAGSAEVLIRRRHGKGTAHYLNLTATAYRHHPFRTGPVGREWRREVGRILEGAGVSPRVRVRENGRSPAYIEALIWKNGGRSCLALVKNYDARASITGQGTIRGPEGNAGATRIEVTFRRPVRRLRNLRTGKVFGDVSAFTDEFRPWEANLYVFE